MIGPPWTALHGAELQPKLQPQTVSLGIGTVGAAMLDDLRGCFAVSDRDAPVRPGVNCPLSAKSTDEGRAERGRFS